MELRAKVTYRNRSMEPVYECDYPLKDYMDVLSMDMKKLISDVEDLVYQMNGNKAKDEWSEADLIAFNKIRSKLLDKAGEIGRLPDCIYDGAQDNTSPASFWERAFNGRGK